jgi:hypothetical protein
VVEGGNPLPPLFKAIPDKSVLRRGCWGKDSGFPDYIAIAASQTIMLPCFRSKGIP